MEFRNIYKLAIRTDAKEKMKQWIEKTKTLPFDHFNTAANSIKYHLESIVHFFNNRNANAESFNQR